MKKILIVSAAVLLLAAGCGKKPAQPSQKVSQKSSGQQTFKELASGKPQKCEVKFSQDNAQSQGTVYVGEGKMRSDSTATMDGKTVVSHIILDGNVIYTWVDGQGTGFKMPATLSEAEKSQAGQKRPVDLEQKVSYTCEDWSVDNSLFTPPSNVIFTDFSNLVPKMPAPGANVGASQHAAACSACEQAPEASRAQCKAALGCK